MSAPSVSYTRQIHGALARYATWLPTDKITVGTVGQLADKLFVPLTHLSKFGVTANVVRDPDTKATYKFVSSGTKEASVGGSTSGVPTSVGFGAAKLNINFSKANSVYFSLAGCTGAAIDDLISLGNDILHLVKEGQWSLEYAVVTRVVNADSATILQAESSSAAIELEADVSGTPVTDLLKSGGRVRVNSQNSVGLNVLAEKRLTPLFSLAKIQYTILDRILDRPPRLSYALPRRRLPVKQLVSHLKTTPNIDLKGKVQDKADVLVSVKLAKLGDYLDMSPVVDLTTKISSVDAKASKKPTTLLDSADLCTRVSGDDLFQAIEKLPDVDLDETGTTKDFVYLDLKLPKSGSTVNTDSLFNLALKTAQPNARANVNAELSFAEIA